MKKIIYNAFNCFTILLVVALVGCKKKDVDLSKAFVKYYGGLKADAGVEVLQTTDGGYVIAGTSNGSTTDVDNYDMIIIKTDAQGNEEWHKTFGGLNYDECGSMAITPNNDGYILVGTYGLTSRNWKIDALEVGKDSTVMVAVRVDNLGNLIWEKKFPVSYADTEIGSFGKAIVVNADGTALIAGMVDSTAFGNPVNLDLYALVIDQNGNLIKVGGFDMKPLHYGSKTASDYVSGAIKAFSTFTDEYLISTSTFLSGQFTPRLVKCRMNGIALEQNNAPTKADWVSLAGSSSLLTTAQICRTSDNNYMLTGTSGASTLTSDFYLLKIDGYSLDDLNVGLLQFYTGDGKDAGVSIVATADGGYAVLATTNSTTYTGSAEKLDDVMLIKLSSTGVEEWRRTFGGKGNDSASRIIQTQDGGYLICGTIAFGDDVSNSGASNSITLIKVNSEGDISNLK